MQSSFDEYKNRAKAYDKLVEESEKSLRKIGFLRLLTFLTGFCMSIYIFINKKPFLGGAIFLVTLIMFIYLINLYNSEKDKLKYNTAFKEINEKSLKRLDGSWKDFKDTGSEYLDEKHSYSGDLDIFGRGSLFQWINSTYTYIGREDLKERLKNPLKTSEEIEKTQEALKDLALDLDFKQSLETEGIVNESTHTNPESLYAWAKEKNELYSKISFVFFIRILPVITVFIFIAACFKIIPFSIPGVLFVIQMAISYIGVDKRTASFMTICSYKGNIETYSKMIELIDKKQFKSTYLNKLKDNLLLNKESLTAIKKLDKICNNIYERNNAFFILINILLLWDYKCLIDFEGWRNKYGKNISLWFNSLGEFEALNSLSNLVYDNKDWCMPKICEGFLIRGEELGHPLLKGRVCNDITVDKDKNIVLITGSNMSGKSTFLRTIGINLILSYIGAPVCASYFMCPIMEVYTSMRISDNLENSISSFYAEILRIKTVVAKVKENRRVFFLLDELFKGTNSIDRHAGARALIKQLGDMGAAGFVSTHDLDLCSLENEYKKVINYHFQEYYENNELKFDYKIRHGKAETRNGLFLIKLAGIDV